MLHLLAIILLEEVIVLLTEIVYIRSYEFYESETVNNLVIITNLSFVKMVIN